jgi:DNA-binding CsgD family transcriptional regulator/tetratricopeptide (TPR) repeat protein
MASYLSGDLEACTAYCERAVPLLRDLDDRLRLSSCLTTIAVNGGDLSCIAAPAYREAAYWIRCGEEGLLIARDVGWTAGEAFARFGLSIATGARGQLGRALQEAEAALAIAERIGHRQWSIAARCALGVTLIELLEDDRAAAELETGLADARVSGSSFWFNSMAALLASLQLARGQPDLAAALLSTIGPADTPVRSMGQRQVWFTRAELAMARAQPERALQIVAELAGFDRRQPPAPVVPQLLKLEADALVQRGDLEDAARTYLLARESARFYGYRTFSWRVDAARGHLLRQLKREHEAVAAFTSAQAEIAALAQSIPDAAVRERFQAAALARLLTSHLGPAGTGNGPEGRSPASRLTPRERDVLRLLVEGRSDREIAAALSISPRTVMHHVTAILGKLEVPSRTAAATLAQREAMV